MATRFVAENGSSVIWQADNGKMFGTEAEAIAEENSKAYEKKVNAFIASKTWNRGQDTRAKALVVEFLAWADTEDGMAAIEAAESAPDEPEVVAEAAESGADAPPPPPPPAA
jgi:hypothetical protein